MAASARASSAHSVAAAAALRTRMRNTPPGPEDDMIQARGADARAAQQVPAVGPEAAEDIFDGDLARSESGDHDKSTGNAHDRGIGAPFAAQ